MKELFYVVKETFLSLMKTGNIVMDIIDIAIVAVFVYYGIKFIRENRAGQLVKGILVLVAAYAIAEIVGLNTVSYIMKIVFELGAFALIIVFQPELRRLLEKMGTGSLNKFSKYFLGNKHGEETRAKWTQMLNTISAAAVNMSKSKTGALIVIERKTKLGAEIEKGGTIVDADPSVELFGTIFYEGSPLHDGAVIVRDGKIYAAGCFLPLPVHSEHIPKSLGSRHRAALGISETSDAIVVVVSEETGMISTASDGKLTRSYTRESLFEYLQKEILSSDEPELTEVKSIFKKVIKK